MSRIYIHARSLSKTSHSRTPRSSWRCSLWKRYFYPPSRIIWHKVVQCTCSSRGSLEEMVLSVLKFLSAQALRLRWNILNVLHVVLRYMVMELRIRDKCLRLLTWLLYGNFPLYLVARTINTEWYEFFKECGLMIGYCGFSILCIDRVLSTWTIYPWYQGEWYGRSCCQTSESICERTCYLWEGTNCHGIRDLSIWFLPQVLVAKCRWSLYVWSWYDLSNAWGNSKYAKQQWRHPRIEEQVAWMEHCHGERTQGINLCISAVTT